MKKASLLFFCAMIGFYPMIAQSKKTTHKPKGNPNKPMPENSGIVPPPPVGVDGVPLSQPPNASQAHLPNNGPKPPMRRRVGGVPPPPIGAPPPPVGAPPPPLPVDGAAKSEPVQPAPVPVPVEAKAKKGPKTAKIAKGQVVPPVPPPVPVPVPVPVEGNPPLPVPVPQEQKLVKVGPNAGVFKFEEENHNFGEVPEGPTAEYDFNFVNTGKEPIIISEAHGSCGCTVPTYSKEPVYPGKKGTIHVVYTTERRPGMINKEIIINSNAKQQPMTLRISGTVKEHGK